MRDLDEYGWPPDNPLRRACAGCTHSEFVHADGYPRECLYAECVCRSFGGEVVTATRGGRGRSAA